MTLYLGMGWLILVAFRPLISHVPLPSLAWLVAGGLAYTGGVFFFRQQTPSLHPFRLASVRAPRHGLPFSRGFRLRLRMKYFA